MVLESVDPRLKATVVFIVAFGLYAVLWYQAPEQKPRKGKKVSVSKATTERSVPRDEGIRDRVLIAEGKGPNQLRNNSKKEVADPVRPGQTISVHHSTMRPAPKIRKVDWRTAQGMDKVGSAFGAHEDPAPPVDWESYRNMVKSVSK